MSQTDFASLFAQILPYAETTRQEKLLEQLQKKFSPRSEASADKLNELTFDFFISGNEKAMRMCFSIWESDEFLWHGPKNVGAWLLEVFSLKFYTTPDERPAIHQKLMGYYHEHNVNNSAEKTISSILAGELLPSYRDDYNDKDNTPKEKYQWGLGLAGKYFLMLALRPDGAQGAEPLLQEVEQLVAELKLMHPKIK